MSPALSFSTVGLTFVPKRTVATQLAYQVARISGEIADPDAVRAQAELDIPFRDVRVCVVETAQFLIDNKLDK